MREKMDAMQREFERFFEYLKTHADEFSTQVENLSGSEALIPVSRPNRYLEIFEIEVEDD